MGRVVAFTSVTLDGVMQAPGRPDEDRRGGFEHGGWGRAYADATTARFAGQGTGRGGRGGLLFGRRTYEDFFSVWPKRTDNPFTEVLDNTQKYVASRTLSEPLPWKNSTLLSGDAVEAVARLKHDLPGDLTILGSGELLRSLMARDLVDELKLLIHPLILGSGTRLFPETGPLQPLILVSSESSPKGVLIATYRPAGRG